MGDSPESIVASSFSGPAECLDFRRRWTGSELMDDPQCDTALLLRTVDQFTSINRLVSRYRAVLSRWVLADMVKEPHRDYHVLDLGAGGCDIPVWLLQRSRRLGLRLRVTALDGDKRIVEHARRKCRDGTGLKIHHADLMSMGDFGEPDFIFMNHVLHHLPDDIIPEILRKMSRVARRRWIVSDLLRSRWSYFGFHLLGPFYRHSYAFEDGKRSIRRGFRRHDIVDYLEKAGLNHAIISLLVPGRMVVCGSPEPV